MLPFAAAKCAACLIKMALAALQWLALKTQPQSDDTGLPGYDNDAK